MSPGHSTSRLKRPGDATRAQAARTDASKKRRDDSRFGDLTRAIPEERRIVRGQRSRLLTIGGAALVLVLLAAALFVLPIKAWLREGTAISAKQRQLLTLQQANSQLANDINRLGTKQGIEEAARQEIGYVQRGEVRLTLLPSPAAPTKLPTGWPFDTFTRIVAVRAAQHAPAAPHTSVSPPKNSAVPLTASSAPAGG